MHAGHMSYIAGSKTYVIKEMAQIIMDEDDLRRIIMEVVSSALARNDNHAVTYLSRREVASRLKVDVSTLWRWQRSGYLVPVRVGARVLYPTTLIEQYERGEFMI